MKRILFPGSLCLMLLAAALIRSVACKGSDDVQRVRRRRNQ